MLQKSFDHCGRIKRLKTLQDFGRSTHLVTRITYIVFDTDDYPGEGLEIAYANFLVQCLSPLQGFLGIQFQKGVQMCLRPCAF